MFYCVVDSTASVTTTLMPILKTGRNRNGYYIPRKLCENNFTLHLQKIFMVKLLEHSVELHNINYLLSKVIVVPLGSPSS